MKNIFKYIEQIRSGNSQSAKPEFQEFLFISAFPKSGSSFISLVISDVLNLPILDVVYSHLREQDLYKPLIEEYNSKKYVSKHHTLATTPNIEILQNYNVRPVILTRKLPDVIISLRDHISKTLIWPHFYVPNDFNKWDNNQQYNFLIDLAVPWYLFFFASWKNTEQRGDLSLLFVEYENFHKDKAITIQNILAFMGYKISLEKILDSMEKVSQLPPKQNRLNKAEVYRGKKQLSDNQLSKISEKTKHYTNVDFSSILY
ncbi:sulfotransferase domain-containing protein [Aureisphaera sp. CAU 1614]|uniref:Sulfotransferase domain-containing protein n=1 Tax=Halomarinibacterium sedimenti TaxID=2857106 RepID=A0A9X1FNI4_9FLAO|nr:sulfotransferase domain-containing protein [Halomarinibacterium sedimenti]MBW2937732.1 sulfotransferase domain-containing protein [Halomarinibacterium sedimenti]